MKNSCGEKKWGFSIVFFDGEQELRLTAPVKVSGANDTWFYAGPFRNTDPFNPDSFYTMEKPFEGANRKVYWRLDKPGLVVRPYNDNRLFGQWNYPLGVTMYGLIETGRFKEQDFINIAISQLSTTLFSVDGASSNALDHHHDTGYCGSLFPNARGIRELKDNDYQ